MSQRKVSAKLKQIVEEECFNVVSNELLVSIIDHNKNFTAELIQEFKQQHEALIKCFTTGLKSISESITASIKSSAEDSKELHSKLDLVIEAIENQQISNNSTNTENSKVYEKELMDRRDKYYQKHRSEGLKDYYNELVSNENIFIPRKFRPKVNKSTPDYEKNIQKDFAIENLQRECRILEELYS